MKVTTSAAISMFIEEMESPPPVNAAERKKIVSIAASADDPVAVLGPRDIEVVDRELAVFQA